MNKVIHLIPYNDIGGVERAARTMISASTEGLEFKVETIFPKSVVTNRWKIWNPFYFLVTVVRVIYQKPQLLVVSLWRAYAVGVLVKLLYPQVKLVVFLHLPKDMHTLDLFLS